MPSTNRPITGQLRTAYQSSTAATRGPAAAAGAIVGVRALSDYDDLFPVGASSPTPYPDPAVFSPASLQVVR
jgi:hypothetical protein